MEMTDTENASRTVIVPNSLHNAINTAVDKALEQTPAAAPDRDIFYQTLLEYFDLHGELPEFNLVKKELAI